MSLLNESNGYGVIYSVYSELNPKCMYIGKTRDTLKVRFDQHFRNYKSYEKGKKMKTACSIVFKSGQAKIKALEYINCNDNELLKLECEYIKKYKCVNKVHGKNKIDSVVFDILNHVTRLDDIKYISTNKLVMEAIEKYSVDKILCECERTDIEMLKMWDDVNE